MDKELQRNLIQRVAFGDLFRRSAKRAPEKTALAEKRGGVYREISYRELNCRLNRFVRAMRRLGLRKGDRITVLGPNSIDFAVAGYGAIKGGFVFVPVNYSLNLQDILYILDCAQTKALVFDNALLPLVKKIKAEKPASVSHYLMMPVLEEEAEQGDGAFLDLPSLMDKESDAEIEDVIIWERDIAEISFTSGATSRPKGVLISHLSMYISALQTLIEMAPHLNRETVLGAPLPIFHCGGRTFVNSALAICATTVLFRKFDPLESLEQVQEKKISLCLWIPSMCRAIFFHPELKKYDLSSLKAISYGMAPMDRRTLEFAKENYALDFYLNSGQTEFFPPTNCLQPHWQYVKEGNYWGAPGIMVDGGIMDDDGNILPPGAVGEIVWRGPACMEGYLNNPAATEEARKYGWHHSGDLGFLDEDGLLKFVDRKKDMIKTGGENVSSIKIEEVILSDRRVSAVSVIGLPHEKWEEAVTAFVVKKDETLCEQDVIAVCRSKLGGFEIPKKVVFVRELPQTVTGKLKKNVLREMYKDLYR